MTAGRKPKYDAELRQQILDNLTLGITVEKTCALAGISEQSFFRWCKEKGEFSEAVTRAQAAAHRAAVVAVRTALTTTKTNVHETVTLEETRLRWVNLPDGTREQQSYTYHKTTHNTKVIENPPDWRAGIEYLKRRDRDNWSDKTLIDVNITVVQQFIQIAKEAGVDPEDALNQFMEHLRAESQRLSAANGAGDAESSTD